MKNVLVPESFLYDVWKYIALTEDLLYGDTDAGAIAVKTRLEPVIAQKIEAMERRQSFSAYKNAPQGSVEREAARQGYLEKAGMRTCCRSAAEIPDVAYEDEFF